MSVKYRNLKPGATNQTKQIQHIIGYFSRSTPKIMNKKLFSVQRLAKP